ncbi:hypothetical protein [Streptomyces sp. NPDC002889]|uniref:hypothetical protein n=1 Tax=Streptomyces sp. NPDC002889 TaxID=3364669 RepID=UPI0036A9F228
MAATLSAAQPLVVAVMAVTVLHQSTSAWSFAWGIACIVGVGLVVIGPDAGFDAVGILAGLGGAGVMALGVTLTKRWGTPGRCPPDGVRGAGSSTRVGL